MEACYTDCDSNTGKTAPTPLFEKRLQTDLLINGQMDRRMNERMNELTDNTEIK